MLVEIADLGVVGVAGVVVVETVDLGVVAVGVTVEIDAAQEDVDD